MNYSSQPGSQIQVTQIVDIDIKPGSDPNSINLKSNGVIPVAILTTPSFDAYQVDSLSVRFGPNQAIETHGKGHSEDADNDGDTDLILHFKTQDTGIQNTDTNACLTGTTFPNLQMAHPPGQSFSNSPQSTFQDNNFLLLSQTHR